MDTSSIYENIMMTGCFNRLKAIRNGWKTEDEKAYGLATIIDIGGTDYRSYDFIMKECNPIIIEMIPYLVMELMKAYEITAQFYEIKQNDAHVYSVKENENWPDYVEQSNRKDIFAFSCKGDAKEGLYVFKEFGIGNRIPESLLKTIKTQNGLKLHCYVSMVEKDAYTEVLNHNDNENDPTRGTGIYSLKQFFDFFFGVNEYGVFKKYTEIFTERVRSYFGFEIVRTLKPNTLHNFRKVVRDGIESFDIAKLDTESRITEEQRELIKKHFFEERRFELLTGSSDFAQSYMTAEWLFESLENAGNIDLTSIAMGYFKAIEQLLFYFIKLHVKENDPITRNIFVGKGRPYADEKGNAELSESLMEDDEKSKDINLGALTGFFGFFSERSSQYYYRNKDLLENGITESTYEYIIDVLTGIVGLRNGYFHKHNLKTWDSVVEARNSARLVFYLLLGAYRISESDKQQLGLIPSENHDDYYRLCEYLNECSGSADGLEIPVFYMNGETERYGFWMGYRDDFIEYDIYGEPIYSGAYFRQLHEKNHITKATRDTLPNEIWEGVLKISRSVPIQIEPSGPLKKLYKDGEFFGG